MKTLLKYTLLISILLLFTMCEDEIEPRDYPRLRTKAVTDATTTGATLHAEIIYRGDFEVLSYGFVWDKSVNPSLDYAANYTVNENISSTTFSTTISDTFQSGKTYNVRAFIQTADYLVYGQNVEFTP